MSDAAAVATIAAFDVDGTLTTRDCVVPFLRRVAGARRILPRLVVRPFGLARAAVGRDRDAVKEAAAVAAFRGLHHERLIEIGVDFAEHVHASWLRADVVSRLDDHRRSGDRVVLVSASFEVYLDRLGELLGADAVLATRLEHRDGVCTGRLDGANCRGPEKVRRLHGWLDSEGLDRSAVRVTAYGDSAGDRDLLADADDSHWLSADGRPR